MLFDASYHSRKQYFFIRTYSGSITPSVDKIYKHLRILMDIKELNRHKSFILRLLFIDVVRPGYTGGAKSLQRNLSKVFGKAVEDDILILEFYDKDGNKITLPEE